MVLGVLAALAVIILLAPRVTLFGHVDLPKSEEGLADRAGEMLRDLGYPLDRSYTVYGFEIDESLLVHLRDHDPSSERWERLRGLLLTMDFGPVRPTGARP